MSGDLQFQELTVVWTQEETRERLLFSGRSTSRHPALILGPMWSQVLQVAKLSSGCIELDFVKLEHLNSSTISAVVQFINDVHDGGMRLVIRYDPALKWQVLSFDALQRAVAGFGGVVTFEH